MFIIQNNKKTFILILIYYIIYMGTITSKLIYHPPIRNNFTNKNSQRINKDDFSIEYIFINNNKKNCIIFSHGNACDIYDYYEYFRDKNLNADIFLYDYVGYGKSYKESISSCNMIYEFPCEEYCYKSHEIMIEYVNFLGKYDKIYLMGQSLGTGIVIDYVSKNPEWKWPIILISPYKSICRVIYDSSLLYPIDQFMTINKLKKIYCPVKIYHGKDDEIIDIKHSEDIYNCLNNKILKPTFFDNTNHNDILDKVFKHMS